MDSAVANNRRRRRSKKKKTQPKRSKRMQLHLVRGSFVTGNAVGEVHDESMDAEVWSRLPEELIWEVLRFVPAAKHFQLHLVSREWRQVLTSADFRSTLPASHCGTEEQQQRAGVVACVARPADCGVHDHGRSKTKKKTNAKVVVVDVDLSSFVPPSFWNSAADPLYCVPPYCVVAAADGLVCISNNRGVQRGDLYIAEDNWDEQEECWRTEPWTNDYCVLNPLTRTCRVVPQVPLEALGWLPPTAAALTVLGYLRADMHRHDWNHGGWRRQVHVATFDLTAAGSGRWEVAAACAADERRYEYAAPSAALCSGETYWYYGGRVRVVAGGGGMAEVADLEEPSLELMLGPDASLYQALRGRLVAHRGAVFLVMGLSKELEMGTSSSTSGDEKEDVVMAVCRLARERLEWEVVARLRVADVVRLTGLELYHGIRYTMVESASGLRELLCCTLCWNSLIEHITH